MQIVSWTMIAAIITLAAYPFIYRWKRSRTTKLQPANDPKFRDDKLEKR
ncbi:hypothetical protein NVIE_0643 [Nitrososphaera viennensis EN76]|uniref:Uncharacterized protein n=1 Tax=Nitrososphaera viennensis EN76 TaxID=926571 RepID=A0A060HDQ5_9ARCH|nr:hypothetical protein NVIE_0643 [Nitrososphaera viennensis EN76]